MTILVDSYIHIELSRGRDARIPAKLSIHRCGIAGWYSCSRVGDSASTLRRACLRAQSHRLELADALIAASAVETNALLWTRNRKHYPMAELGFLD